MDKQFFDKRGLAELLHVSPRMVERWIAKGGGVPHVRVSARKILFRAADIAAWIEANRFAHRAEAVAAKSPK